MFILNSEGYLDFINNDMTTRNQHPKSHALSIDIGKITKLYVSNITIVICNKTANFYNHLNEFKKYYMIKTDRVRMFESELGIVFMDGDEQYLVDEYCNMTIPYKRLTKLNVIPVSLPKLNVKQVWYTHCGKLITQTADNKYILISNKVYQIFDKLPINIIKQ